MTDPRPSENDVPQWPGFRAAGFFDDLPTVGKDFFVEPDAAETIDHKAEATRLIDSGIDWVDPRNSPNSTAQLAQIHATLYLADQQRIANVIAWTTSDGHRPTASVQREIEKGLGL